MFLNALLGSASTDELNDLSDKFVQDYPYSPLTIAVQKFISYKFDYGDTGFGMTIGGGYNFNSGRITDYRIRIKSKVYDFDPGFLTVGLRTAYYPNVITNQGGNMKGELFFVGLTLKVCMFNVKRVY
jgi:hypothetical protein